MEDKNIYTLLDFCTSLENNIKNTYPKSFWIKAEISKLNLYNYSGHAYPELVEKKDNKIVAQIRSIIWKNDFLRINAKFLQVTKQPLQDGISITCRARLSYNALYGLSLIIEDIDPYITLGDLEREKFECIERLKRENIWNENKNKSLAMLPQRLAIISVKTSKGYSDFMQTIQENNHGFAFFTYMFHSLLQGDGASIQMVEALNIIEQVKDYFDCVLIIRGGGGDIGLSCYNNYMLCRKIATFPLPILTGIGHSTNETVAEMISYQNCITPTALAEFVLKRFENFQQSLDSLKDSLVKNSKLLLDREKTNLDFSKKRIVTNSSKAIILEKHKCENLKKDITKGVNILFDKEHTKIDNINKIINTLKPENILKKGYSITTLNGNIITNANQVKKNDKIITKTFNGEFSSIVE